MAVTDDFEEETKGICRFRSWSLVGNAHPYDREIFAHRIQCMRLKRFPPCEQCEILSYQRRDISNNACLALAVRNFLQESRAESLLTNFFRRDAEIASGIICGCMPALPRFFNHVGPRIYGIFKSKAYDGPCQGGYIRVIPVNSAKARALNGKNHWDSPLLEGKSLDLSERLKYAQGPLLTKAKIGGMDDGIALPPFATVRERYELCYDQTQI